MLTDIHAHILPCVDDGARDLDESIRMLETAYELGVRGIVATPHARRRFKLENAYQAYETLRPIAAARGIALELGCELHYDLLLKLDAKQLKKHCSLKNHLLLEFDNHLLPPEWEYTLSDLIDAGYRVIIAHPERYRPVQKNPDIVQEMRGYGCSIQLDAVSYHARPWSEERRTFSRILDNGWADYIASDAHNAEDYRIYGEVLGKLAKRYPHRSFRG